MQPKWPTAGIETPPPLPGSGTGAKSAKTVNRQGPTALVRPTGPVSDRADPAEEEVVKADALIRFILSGNRSLAIALGKAREGGI